MRLDRSQLGLTFPASATFFCRQRADGSTCLHPCQRDFHNALILQFYSGHKVSYLVGITLSVTCVLSYQWSCDAFNTVCSVLLQQNSAQLSGPELASTDWHVHLQPPRAGRLQSPGWLPAAKDWYISFHTRILTQYRPMLLQACSHLQQITLPDIFKLLCHVVDV